MERPLLLTLQFDGSGFCGWQRQRSGRSVQQVVEAALEQLTAAPRRTVAAGRTDAGVHALAMPVSVRVPVRWECRTLLRALNAVLPADVAVSEVRAIAGDTDARHAALERRYRYDIATDGGARSPFLPYTWPLGHHLDVDAMNAAAVKLMGCHDFRAFSTVGEPKPHYRCTVRTAEWITLDNGLVRFAIAADRFLHHMVRMLVGTMVDIGRGRRAYGDIAHLLTTADNRHTSAPAPARGLTFVAARFAPEYFLADCATW